MDLRIFIPHRLEYTEHVLFLILTFGGSTIRNSWATPLAAATRTIPELVLFKSLYISSLYGTLHFSKLCQKLEDFWVKASHIAALTHIYLFNVYKPTQCTSNRTKSSVCLYLCLYHDVRHIKLARIMLVIPVE